MEEIFGSEEAFQEHAARLDQERAEKREAALDALKQKILAFFAQNPTARPETVAKAIGEPTGGVADVMTLMMAEGVFRIHWLSPSGRTKQYRLLYELVK